jgi:hypothetical protein
MRVWLGQNKKGASGRKEKYGIKRNVRTEFVRTELVDARTMVGWWLVGGGVQGRLVEDEG